MSTPTSAPFWAALREERVDLQHCGRCDAFVFYPRSHCPTCLSEDLVWRTVSGRGNIHAFTVAREPTAPLFADEVPQVLAIIEFDEGPRMTSTIVDSASTSVVIGARVEPVFDHRGGEVTLVRFRTTAV